MKKVFLVFDNQRRIRLISDDFGLVKSLCSELDVFHVDVFVLNELVRIPDFSNLGLDPIKK